MENRQIPFHLALSRWLCNLGRKKKRPLQFLPACCRSCHCCALSTLLRIAATVIDGVAVCPCYTTHFYNYWITSTAIKVMVEMTSHLNDPAVVWRYWILLTFSNIYFIFVHLFMGTKCAGLSKNILSSYLTENQFFLILYHSDIHLHVQWWRNLPRLLRPGLDWPRTTLVQVQLTWNWCSSVPVPVNPQARLDTFSLIALYLLCSSCWYVAPEQEDVFLAVAGMEHGGEWDPTALKMEDDVDVAQRAPQIKLLWLERYRVLTFLCLLSDCVKTLWCVAHCICSP